MTGMARLLRVAHENHAGQMRSYLAARLRVGEPIDLAEIRRLLAVAGQQERDMAEALGEVESG